MMKSLTNIIFIIVFLPLLSFGQQRWETVFGNPNINDYPSCIANSYDGGYFICGNDELQQGSIYKTDRNGSILWNKVIKKDGNSLFSASIAENKAGDKVIVGDNNGNGLIMLFDKCGELNWCRQLINDERFIQTQYIDVLLLNSSILTVGYFVDTDNNNMVYLLNFDYEGNLLWMKEIAGENMDHLLGLLIAVHLEEINKTYFLSGLCYYAYPNNPDLVWARGMFIKVDSLFNKDWFLPYGMPDSLDAFSAGVIPLDSLNYRGYGSYFLGYTDTLNSIFMDFDSSGNETGHIGISNNTISPEVKDNDLMALTPMNDSTYMITAQVGNIPLTVNPIGEFTIDTGGTTVYHYQNHLGAYSSIKPTVKTVDDKYVFLAKKTGTHTNILLYKLNADLSQADYDTATYVYDSLCPDAITSDTIYLDDCGIITGMEEIPSPEEYYKAIAAVQVTAYPNPANGSISFKLKNTKYHIGLQLNIYDISGKHLLYRQLENGQSRVNVNISALPAGMYVAVVNNRQKVMGKAVFSVE